VEVFDFGYLDISGHNDSGVTVGSIEGTGDVFLGANNLSVGSNNRSTTFSGLIQDGFSGTGGGSLTKIGRGTLILTGANTYTGGTTIEEGQLLVDNTTGSGLGSGSVQVNAGRLGGNGTIAGAVTLGTGSGAGATLAPGERCDDLGTITIQGPLTFNSDSRYNCGLKTRRHAVVDTVVANGVTINGGQFVIAAHSGSALPHGTILTVIDNTAATPIAGTFGNLADGSIFTIGNNTYQVSYEGNDGNDLTLTVQ
jgi:autotransporter-associated beta strand protein